MTDPAIFRHYSLATLLTPAVNVRRSLWAWIVINIVVCAVYSLAGLVIVYFGIGPAKISPIYPPAGIAVGATMLFGPRVLPAVFVGQFLNGFPLFENPNTTVAMYALSNTGTGIGSMLEALLALGFMRRFAGAWHPFERPLDVVVFLAGSCLFAALICGTIGTFSLWAGGFVPPQEVRITFITFVLADAAGIALFCSLILAWYREPEITPDVVINSGLMLAAVGAIGAIEVWTRYPIDYLFLLLLLWAALRASARGVTLTATAITIVAILTAITGVGSFAGSTANETILLLEGFIGAIIFTGLIVVSVRAQQLEAEIALEAHNRMLEQRVAQRTAEVADKNRQLEEKQERIDADLRTAQVLQASILPTDFSAYQGSAIAASMKPALEVGGDFYDVFPLGPGQIGLVVADVSGKGVAAAFFMAVTRTMLRGVATRGTGPAAAIGYVNDALCRENPIDMFVTALYAELDETSGTVTLVNAGHCEPIITGPDGQTRLLRRAGNPPLGVIPQKTFAQSTFTLAPDEMLFLYTDGVTEAFNRDGDQFRVERLFELARRFAEAPPRDLMLAVIGDVETFSAGAMQADDMTCLVIRRNPIG